MNYESVLLISRNVLFSKKTETILENLQKKAKNDKVRKWVKSNLRKYLINDHPASRITKNNPSYPEWVRKVLENKEELYKIDLSSVDRNTFLHWIDYLNTLENEKDLSKFSIPQVKKKVEEWDIELAKAGKNIKEEDGIRTIYKYESGFAWVNVFGEQSIKREGDLMGHCVGRYYDEVKEGLTRIFSLRDMNNMPHVTIEITKRKVVEQIKGKKNQRPVQKYMPYVLDFLNGNRIGNKIKINSANEEELKFAGIYHSEGENKDTYYDIYNLPENFTISRSILLGEYEPSKNADVHPDLILPENLHVKGDLNLLHCYSLKELPKNLTVDGSLILTSSNIKRIPDTLRVKGEYYFADSNVENLPNGFRCFNLDLTKSSIVVLPENLHVEDTLMLHPKTTTVPGTAKANRIFSNSGLVRIEDGITVNSMYLISSPKLSYLPKNLKMKGSLRIGECNLKKLPEDLQVETLSISHPNSIETLPSGLKVTNLFIDKSSIKKLPDGLVLKELRLNEIVDTLPLDLKVTKYLEIPYHSSLKRIPEYINPEIVHVNGQKVTENKLLRKRFNL